MFRLRQRDRSLEAALKQIEHRVLDDVHLPLWARRVAWVAVMVLVASGITTWVVGESLPLAASALGVGAAVCSIVTLRRRRFRWSVAAACVSGVSTVAGVGTFWWCQTSSAVATLAISSGVSAVATATLTAVWVAVAITPVTDSQPDMRQPSKRRWGVRESGDTIIWPPPCAGPRFPGRK